MAEDKKVSKTQGSKSTTKKKPVAKTTTKKVDETKTQKKAVKTENVKKEATKAIVKEEPKATKATVKEEPKATKVTTKPVTPKYVNSKEAKNPKRGQVGLILLLVLIIAVSVFFINTFRKYAILVDLAQKVSNYVTSENYHEIATYDRNFEDYGAVEKVEAYRKGNTTKGILYSPDKGIITTINSTTAGSKMFMNLKTGKVMTYNNENKELFPVLQPQDMIGEAKFLNSIFTGVHSEKLDDIDCYVLDNKLFSKGRWTGEPKSYKIYIEKATGLLKQLIQEEAVKGEVQILTIKYSYQFDNVKDEDLRAPSDIGEYVIQK